MTGAKACTLMSSCQIIAVLTSFTAIFDYRDYRYSNFRPRSA